MTVQQTAYWLASVRRFRYSFPAVAKSAAGIGVPFTTLAGDTGRALRLLCLCLSASIFDQRFYLSMDRFCNGIWLRRGLLTKRAGFQCCRLRPARLSYHQLIGVSSGSSLATTNIGGCHYGYDPHPVTPRFALCLLTAVRRADRKPPYLHAPHRCH